MPFVPPTRDEIGMALLLLDVHIAFSLADYSRRVPEIMSEKFPGYRHIHIDVRDVDHRAFVLGQLDNTLIVVNEGIRESQFPGVAIRARNMVRAAEGWRALPDAYNDARRVYARYLHRRRGMPDSAILSGFSIGGAIMENFAATLIRDGIPARSIRQIHFGSPKPGDIDLAQRNNLTDIRRWVNFGDSVPLIPPDQNAINYLERNEPRLARFFTPDVLGDYYLYRQPEGATVISAQGGATGFPEGQQLDSLFAAAAQAFYSLFGTGGNPREVVRHHWPQEYQRRIQALWNQTAMAAPVAQSAMQPLNFHGPLVPAGPSREIILTPRGGQVIVNPTR